MIGIVEGNGRRGRPNRIGVNQFVKAYISFLSSDRPAFLSCSLFTSATNSKSVSSCQTVYSSRPLHTTSGPTALQNLLHSVVVPTIYVICSRPLRCPDFSLFLTQIHNSLKPSLFEDTDLGWERLRFQIALYQCSIAITV